MRSSAAITGPMFAAALVYGFLLTDIGEARAFEDDECSRIVTTSQHRLVDLRPGETAEIAHARAMDEVSKLAVAEVIGVAVNASQSLSSNLNNESDTRHTTDPNSPGRSDAQIDRNGVESRYQTAAQYDYRGLVRVKLRSEAVIGPADHQGLDILADVTVCQPKPKELMILDRQPPQVVDPNKTNWFNPTTGESQLWYWAAADKTYIFYDKSGFDPNTGDPLKRVDQQFQKEWQALMAKRRKDALDLAERQQREAILLQQQSAAAKEAADLRAAQDAQHIQRCDASAANPTDPRKPASIAGAAWDVLKANAAAAISDCQAAVRLQPAEARFRYQLARAYSVNDPKRALPLLKTLCDEGYPAAFDNYGWALLDRRVGRSDLDSATQAFELGVDAGDSASMVSLAGFIRRGSYNEAGPEDALLLYRRAAKLGNADAIAAVSDMEAEQARAEALKAKQAEDARLQAIQQQQAAQMLMGAMGGVLRNVGRH